MKKPLAQLGAWNRLLDSTVKDNIPTPTASLAHPQAINCAPALIAAFAICGVLGGISLLVPPSIDWDSAIGFLAWRGTLLGAVNSIIEPDRSNIARDTVSFLTWWSPGQYLVPGAISLLGLPLGAAMTLTVTLALLCCLIGWMVVVREFAPNTTSALLVVVSVGSFRYSTHAFTSYHGGEILLEAVTPWLILAALSIPAMNVLRAALLAAGAVLVAFIAKLTGLIVVAASLVAACLVSTVLSRRITQGVVGGALGAVMALIVIYVSFLSRGSTPATGINWSLPLKTIAGSFFSPWVAGMSWGDLSIFFRPNWGGVSVDVPIGYLAIIAPVALLIMYIIVGSRLQTTDAIQLRRFALLFYGMTVTCFIVLYIKGGAHISFEERHFRSAGTLLFLCALISAFAAGTPAWIRGSFLVLCALMALYGVASFSNHELRTAKGQSLDRASWTNQGMFDAAAIDFAREIYAREGRDALFVLPLFGQAQSAVTMPVDARILVMNFDFEPESAFVGRYFGRVPGHVVVLVPNNMFDTSKGVVLSAFTDYAPDAWNRKTFANTSVYFQ
jgi:hypothetical protein